MQDLATKEDLRAALRAFALRVGLMMGFTYAALFVALVAFLT